ncbi:glycine betaine transport integral membrane protein BetP [Mycobacteroides abscessus subsp. abscessus]|nr:glycine betaine transport integral membrane protein BetP [Mycobacteroides abscessus subsp. abscessus]
MLHSLHRRLGLKTTPGIFFPSAAFILLFSAATIAFPQTMIDVFGAVSGWILTYLGWFYVLGTALCALFLVYVCVSRFGRIKLGPDDSEPQIPPWPGSA